MEVGGGGAFDSVHVVAGPFFMLAQSELAPKEDQGVVFSILLPSPTSTIDQNLIFSEEVQKMFTSRSRNMRTPSRSPVRASASRCSHPEALVRAHPHLRWRSSRPCRARRPASPG
jgi:hypothetical protein